MIILHAITFLMEIIAIFVPENGVANEMMFTAAMAQASVSNVARKCAKGTVVTSVVRTICVSCVNKSFVIVAMVVVIALTVMVTAFYAMVTDAIRTVVFIFLIQPTAIEVTVVVVCADGVGNSNVRNLMG